MLQSKDDANTDCKNFYCAACSVVQSEMVTDYVFILIYRPRTRNGRLGTARRVLVCRTSAWRRVLVFGLAHGKPTHYHTAVV